MHIDPSEIFQFQLDDFQLEAIRYLDDGKSIVVCAPTGSGKTVIAEYAVESALRANQRCFYTTPLKALSNQKFGDLQVKYGEHQVGLLTGDVSINRDAGVVVMTTEVFRNMLYGTVLGDVNRNLKSVSSVILDECHYMNDSERGTVWEESIIYAPKNIQLVALSATIANADELTTWIDRTHGPTELVWSDHRPVPLRFYYFGDRHIYPLLNPGGGANTQLKSRFGKKRRFQRDRRRMPPVASMGPAPGDVLAVLSSRNMLPAIYFLFSRKGCEEAMESARGIPLLKHDEEEELRQVIKGFIAENPNLAKHPHLPYVYEGMSVHHAGMLPSWKAMSEKLFQKGLLKVIFATETLAAGINMPARTTVISSLSKRGDEGRRQLTASEFLQMSGRAGRRGMDEVGHVVVLSHPFEPVDDAAKLSTAPSDPLSSRFTPSYGMVLNLLQRHSLDECRELIERSFGQFLANRQFQPVLDQRASWEKELAHLSHPLCPGEIGDLNEYSRKLEAVKSKHKQMKAIEKGTRLGGEASYSSAARNRRGMAPPCPDALDITVADMRREIKQILDDAYGMPCHGCPVQKPCSKQSDRVAHLQGRLTELDKRVARQSNQYWLVFMALCDVLKIEGYLSGSRPTRLGETAAGIRGQNELFLCEVAVSGILTELEPAELAAVLTALVSEGRGRDVLNAHVSPAVENALERIDKIARKLHRTQRDFEIDISVGCNSELAGLTEMWAQGRTWEEISHATAYDEGDVVRCLRRTLDLARQFMRAPHMDERLVELCRQVETRIARDEIKQEV